MRPFLTAALYIAFVLAVAAVALSAQSDASRALPSSDAPFVSSLRFDAAPWASGWNSATATPDGPAGAVQEEPIDQLPVRSAAPTPVPSASNAAGASPARAVTSPSASPVVSARPTSMPRHALRAFTGQSSWWYSFGPGAYAAMRPDLHVRNGTLVTVCAGGRCYPDPVKVITTCQCLGPGSNRIIDLSRDVFAWFAPPSQGVLHVTVEVLA